MHNTKFKNRPVGCHPPARPAPPKEPKRKGRGMHGPGGRQGEGGHAAYIDAPHLGGCSDTHNTMLWHNCLVVCHSREVWKGPSPAAPSLAPGQGHFSFLSAAVGSSLGAPGASLGAELSS